MCSLGLEKKDVSFTSVRGKIFRLTSSAFCLSTELMIPTSCGVRVKKLAALAFVPVADVVACFQSLATIILADELPLLAYFEGTWIGQSVGGRIPPSTFPHHMWNVLDRSAAGSTRTANSLEATPEPQLMTSFEDCL